ncbi:MAG: GldG family protein [Thermoanaerobaculum sp.]|nr:GldG family protein [Thermoanaerobaculum sp.]MDW7967216.1 GldG family protein [Thermoanaerobaculum sp.]
MRKEKVFFASTVGIALLLTVALVGMVNWLAFRHYWRWDWTQAKVYSLSAKTLNVLKGVKEPVRVVVFMTGTTPLFEQVKELISRYQASCPKLAVEFIDPDRDPLRTRQLAQEFGVSMANTVVFAQADRKKYVSSDQLAEYDYTGVQFGQAPKIKAFKGEEQFTSAILQVTNPKVPKAYFTTGHGEHDLDGWDERGFSQLKELLKRDNWETVKLPPFASAVPEDCDLLVVAGPTAPFAEVEKQALASYLDRGGRALVLLDPVLPGRQQPSGLEELLAKRGVKVGNDLVVDPERRLPFFDLSAVFVNEFRAHPTVDPLRGMAVLLPVARSVSTSTVEGVKATTLFTTSAAGFGETDLQGLLLRRTVDKNPEDTPGPVSLAVAAEPEKPEGTPWRLVVVGDSDFATNGQLANAGNANLLANLVNWLGQREESLGIAPRQPEQVNLVLSAAQLRMVMLLSLVGLPALGIVLGVVVWWRRRR